MPAPTNVDEFLDIVRRSGVVEDTRVKPYIASLTEQNELPTEPSKLAGLMVRDGLLSFFQADQLLQGKWKRFFIGKYKVLERLGAGGMGQVFLCEHKLMRRRVAVKVLPAPKAADPASLERFYREARAVAAVDHANIVRAYDIDQDENLHFLVMEHVDGTNLQDLVKKSGPLDPVRACHYIYGSAVGLQHASEMGLVHRDVKPGNILVDRSGVVKVLDMGLARFFNDTDDALTKKYDESILGTADYLAPEQALDSTNVDSRADIYSLGATFYYLLTGQAVFPEGSVAQKLLWHQTREPTPIRTLRPNCPPELADIVVKMMAKDRAHRFQSHTEVMAALGPWVQTPIPPPAERELPQLSLAASGGLNLGTPRSNTALRVSAVASETNVAMAVPVSGSLGAEVPQPPAEAPRSTPSEVAPTPVPVRPVAVVAAPQPELVWEDLATDTQTSARADTDRTQPRAARRAKLPADGDQRAPATPAVRKRKQLVIGLAVLAGLLAVGGGVGYFAFAPGNPSTTEGTTQTGPRKWYVARGTASPDPSRTYATLFEALKHVKKDETVVLLDDLNEMPIRIGALYNGVRIESGRDGHPVTWTLPKLTDSAAKQAAQLGLLTIVSVEGFHLSGVVLDCGEQTESGLVVAGRCPGLVVENVTLQAPKQFGIRFRDADGDAERPMRVSRFRVVAKGKLDAAGVGIEENAHHLKIELGRLEGPGEAAFRVNGSCTNVEFSNNRVYQFDDGLRITDKAVSDAPLGLTLANNTFHTLNAGVSTKLALTAMKRQLTLTKNYFANTKEIVAAASADTSGLKATDTAKDAATQPGRLTPLPTVIADLPKPDPAASDADFLRTSSVKALAGFGAQ